MYLSISPAVESTSDACNCYDVADAVVPDELESESLTVDSSEILSPSCAEDSVAGGK